MSMIRALVLVLVCGAPRAAAAQFVPDEPRDPDAARQSEYDTRLTSTTLVYRETGRIGAPLLAGAIAPENASPIARYFTDLRAQIDGKHLSGGRWDLRFDGRARATADQRIQSGTFSGSEYDLRELHFRRRGRKSDWTLGRQVVLDIAATKIDGLSFTHRASPSWNYVGFAGLYPARGSRSLASDYPQAAPDAMGQPGGRLLPAAAGVGAAYRLEKYYGALGVAGILPLADDAATGTLEKPRLFATANGYWRQSLRLDLYHYAVVDATGAAGAGLTNLSVGFDFHPQPTYHLTGAVNHVDTETLNVTAQTRLEDPDPGMAALVQNNVEVARIAADEARAGLSVALGRRRFELSVDGRLRRRPEIAVRRNDDTTLLVPAAQALDVTLAALDRSSIRGFRLGAQLTSIRGVGQANLNRSESRIARVSAARELAEGRSELELDLTWLDALDDRQGEPCEALDPLTCYGTAQVTTLQAGGLLFHRFDAAWFLVLDLHAGRQSLTIDDAMGGRVEQPPILVLTGFGRLDYRF